MGLITQALDRAPRWAIKKLTTTYLTLHLSDIGQQVGIADVDEVKSLILSMVNSTFAFVIPRVLLMIFLLDRVLGNLC